MAKKSKLSTPEWILEGFDSKEDWEKAHGKKSTKETSVKKFKIKVCPKCGGNVSVVLSNLDVEEDAETGKEWGCKSCLWKGSTVEEKEVSEEEFINYIKDIENK